MFISSKIFIFVDIYFSYLFYIAKILLYLGEKLKLIVRTIRIDQSLDI